jgi:hypothetical protein
MRMRHIAVIAALALVGVPAGALAAKPSHPTTPANTNASTNANGTTTTTSHGNSASAKVTFVLRGKVTSYTPGTSLMLTLKSSNRNRSTLTSGSPFTATIGLHTKIVLHEGAPIATGDMVVVKIHAAKNTSTLPATATAQVIDQGPSH